MKNNKYKDKQNFTKKRKDSLKKYNREKIFQKYQIEINNGKNELLELLNSRGFSL
jgi:hypothetical protein